MTYNYNDFYPKVMIIGHCPNELSGAGITLMNLFSNWPREKLCFILHPSIKCSEEFNLNNNIFRFTEKEIKYLFSSLLSSRRITRDSSTGIQSSNSRINYKYYVKKFVQKTGLFHIRFKYYLSEELRNWIIEQKPDILYSALGELNITDFLNEISMKLAYPVVVHIWDDWPNTIHEGSILSFYWKYRYNRSFRRLIFKSTLRLSISEGMSEYYFEKYGLKFIPFHNPVELNSWPTTCESRYNDGIRRIIYVGKINRETIIGIKDMGNAINLLPKSTNVIFEVYSQDKEAFFREKLNMLPNIQYRYSLSHIEVPKYLMKADILYLPLSFSRKSIRYTKVSFPTKLSEYMMAKVPIILYLSSKISLFSFAQKTECFNVVSERSPSLIAETIMNILQNSEQSLKKAKLAREYAVENFQNTKVCERLKNEICGVLK